MEERKLQRRNNWPLVVV